MAGIIEKIAKTPIIIKQETGIEDGKVIFGKPPPGFADDQAKKSGKKKTASCVRKQLAVRKIPGIVLLSHSQIYSTIAAGALNYRVREGNECFCSAMDTGKYKTKK